MSRPTCIAHTSATVIGNVYMTCPGYRNVNLRIIVFDISDHYAILVCMGESDLTRRKEPLVYNHLLIDINKIGKLNTAMHNTNWAQIFTKEHIAIEVS